MKFNIEVKSEYNIEFTKPDIAEDYFCGEDFSSVFWSFTDLSEVGEHVIINFKKQLYSEFSPLLEGFGIFELDRNVGKYICNINESVYTKESFEIKIQRVEDDFIEDVFEI